MQSSKENVREVSFCSNYSLLTANLFKKNSSGYGKLSKILRSVQKTSFTVFLLLKDSDEWIQIPLGYHY